MGEPPSHTAVWAPHLWRTAEDEYDAETIQNLRQYHGDTYSYPCYNCNRSVHYGDEGHNEQDAAYIRYGPILICGACLVEAFDLPEVPSNWPYEPFPKDGETPAE